MFINLLYRLQWSSLNKNVSHSHSVTRLLFQLLVAIAACSSVASFADSKNSTSISEPVFKMWLGAGLPDMENFELAVVKLSLENSKAKYGNYQFQTQVASNTIKRQERIFHSSVETSINVSPMNSLYNDKTEGGYYRVPFSIANGILGYRQLLVRRERLKEFQQIKTYQDLHRYSIGQVAEWADVEVLESNGLDVRAVPKYELLFPMLLNNRFDSVSIGCTEVESLSQFLDQHYPGKFAFVPDLVIFYPFALHIFLNRNEHNALERITYGYEVAKKNGDIDKLFETYHGTVFKQLKSRSPIIIKLKNDHMSSEGAEIQAKLLE